MCKLVVAFNKGDDRFKDLVKAQFEAIRDQKDGCGGLVITQDNQEHVFKSVENYDSVFDSVEDLLDTAKLVVLHTRIGTVGGKTIENVHLFDNPLYYFAHNGHVSRFGHTWSGKQMGFTTYSATTKPKTDNERRMIQLETIFDKCYRCYHMSGMFCEEHKHLGVEYDKIAVEEYSKQEESGIEVPTKVSKRALKIAQGDKSDSRMFVDTMPKNITAGKLEKKTEDDMFTGFGFLMNKITKEIFLIVKKEVHTTFTDRMAMFTSYKPSYSYKELRWAKVMGIDIMFEKEEIKLDLTNYPTAWGTYKVQGYQ